MSTLPAVPSPRSPRAKIGSDRAAKQFRASLCTTNKFPLQPLTEFFQVKCTVFVPPNDWLNPILVAVSHDAAVFALASGRKLIIVTRDRMEEFHAAPLVNPCPESDSISALTIVSIPDGAVGDVKSYISVLVIGFTSGTVKIFSQNGDLIHTQLIHRTAVLKMKLATSAATGIFTGTTENLSILYQPNLMAVIDGISLYNVIHTYFRVTKTTTAVPISLEIKKWHLEGGIEISDFAIRSQVTENVSNYFITVAGQAPMLAFFEGTSTQRSDSVTTAVAEKLVSIARNWWSGPAAKPVEERPEAPPQRVAASSLLEDPSRQVTSVTLSPTGHLAASTDNLARVMLIDVRQSITVKMWKGYRDAQCAWLTHDDDSKSFLVIYAAKRGIIEVWKVRHGTRIAAYNVGLGCRLLGSTPFGPGVPKPTKVFLLRPDLQMDEIVLSFS